ncbi:MAG: tRNA (N6-isopentenyl adenosine(37)-C2)-methylthiotransferase MiaB [Chitinivibrionales bacterium]|nr:tRNA (N6-isopentenyl adenosine(37)-C2)-methylthiotransferase MiaB [Chitinivibrionales bacterium]
MPNESHLNYHLVTLGCQMNKADSERFETVLHDVGYVKTLDEHKAQLLGILACSVRQKAIDKVYSRIHKWNTWKNKRNLITFVSGCILPDDKEKFLKLFDLVFPTKDVDQLPELLTSYGIVSPVSARPFVNAKGSTDALSKFWNVQPSYANSFEAFVPIQNGCDKFCTFCAVPYTRGREVSRPSQEIIDEVEKLIENDYKSITLLGQNVNSYGRDKNGSEISFAQLLDHIGSLGDVAGKEFKVYFTSPHPRDMTDDVIDAIAGYACLAKQLHLPLQSGDDKLLIKMNRKHSVARYRHIIDKIRTTLPGAAIFTDLIVGFTGETEGQFENTRRAVREFDFNMAYIAQYSPRPGAASSRWKDDIPAGEKKRRFETLTKDLEKIAYQKNASLVGKTMRVLVTGRDRKNEYYTGYTEGRIPARFVSERDDVVGTFVDLEITSSRAFSIEGNLVN